MRKSLNWYGITDVTVENLAQHAKTCCVIKKIRPFPAGQDLDLLAGRAAFKHVDTTVIIQLFQLHIKSP